MSNFALKALLFLALVFPSISSFGQLNKAWETRYDPPGYSTETAFKSATDAYGNIYAIGKTANTYYYGDDAILFKYNSSGSLLWKYQFGRGLNRANNQKGDLIDFALDSKANSYLLFSDAHIVKFDSDGNVVWQKSFSYYYRLPKFFRLDETDNLYLFSNNADDFEVMKISSDGNQLWTKARTKDGKDDLRGGSVGEGKVIVWGLAQPDPTVSTTVCSIVAYDADGTFLWNTEDKSWNFGIGKVFSGNFYIQIDNNLRGYNLSTGKMALNYVFTEMFGFIPFSHLLTSPDGILYAIFTSYYDVSVTKITSDHLVTKNVYGGYYTYRYTINDALLDPVTNKVYVACDVNKNIPTPHYSSVMRFNDDGTNSELIPTTTKTSFSVNSLSKDPAGFINLFGTFDNAEYLNDFLLMQVKSTDFTKTWETPYVQGNTLQNKPKAICYDGNGNTYVAGNLPSNKSGNEVGNYGVIKYDKDGNEVWRLKYLPDGVITYNNTALAIAINSNNELFVTGTCNVLGVSMYTIKVSPQGNVLWSKAYAISSSERGTGLQVVAGSQGDCYVLYTKKYDLDYSQYSNQVILVKYDSMGNKVWEKIYDKYYDYVSSPAIRPIVKMIDNEIYVFTNKGNNVEVIKMDLAGIVLLQKEVTMADLNHNYCSNCWINLLALDVNKAANGNVYLLISSSGGGKVVSLSPAGNIQWINTSGKSNWSNSLTFGSLALNSSSDAYTVLSGYSHIEYARVGNDGKTIWNKRDSLTGYNSDYSQATYVFLKQDESPMFIGTNALNTPSSTRDYFFQERNKNTGEIQTLTTFDGGYDLIPDYYAPNYDDELIAFYKILGKDEFVVTGTVAGKMTHSITIVTMKYTVPTPSAGFVADKTKVIENQPVTFTDKSAGSLVTWTWAFTGGTPASYVGKNPPSVSYSKAGKYPVTLVVKDDNGTSYEKTVQDYITVYQKIHADFVTSTAFAGIPTNFVNESVGAINSYEWGFEGATPSISSGQQPKNIIFNEAGTYKVSLKVTNEIDSDVIEKEITVQVVTGIVPGKDAPAFSPNPTSGALVISCPANEIAMIEVYNTLGTKVAEPELANGEINISALVNGMYIVRLTKTDNQTFVQKVLKY